LLKAIYGLIQAARQWWKKFKKILIKLSYKSSAKDSCLFFRKNKCEDTLTVTFVYVDVVALASGKLVLPL